MQEILINKLHEYIRENNPDILLPIQESGGVSQYLTDKVNAIGDLLKELEEASNPAYMIEEVCMEALTKDLKPSKFNYICAILDEDFEPIYQQLQESGTLKFEVINIITYCQPVFESFGFTEENENERQLRYAVTGAISGYLENNK